MTTRNILLSGGTRGLGLAIAQELAGHGYRVVATGRRASTELDRLISESEGRVSFESLDLRDSTAIHNRVRHLTDVHGPWYGLVNNAALAHDGILATMHESQIDELIDVNLRGTLLLTKYVSRSMLTRREGRIINIASVIGHTGFSGLSVYAATKAALLGFTKSLARELGKAEINVNSVSPGYLETDMTADVDAEVMSTIRRRSALGRIAKVDDVARAVEFLLSDAAKSITGTDIVVDAGSIA